MGSRPHGRVAIVTVLLAAAWTLLPASASARTIEVNGAPYWHGKVVNVGGLGWGTAYGVCPAGPIEIRSGVAGAGGALTRVGTVPSTSVIPLSGGFATDVRLTGSRRGGRLELVLTQTERTYSFPAGCGEPHETRTVRVIETQRPPPGAPCTLATECSAPEPRLLISRSAGGLPSGASLPPPSPVCPVEGCSKGGPGEPLYDFSPGAELWLFGSGFPGVFFTFAEGCSAGSTGAITFNVIDRSGTGFPLGLGDVGSGTRAGTWVLFDSGTFQTAVRVVLPTRGLAYGRAVMYAVRTGFEGDPVCGQVASAPFTISRPRQDLTLLAPAIAGSTVAVHGTSWGTDECDGQVEVIESRGKADRILAKVSPGDLGDFSAEVAVKELGGAGKIKITASQDSGIETADERGRPSRARCVRNPKAIKTFDTRPAKVVAVVPDPPPPPPPDPPPVPVPTVTAVLSTPTNIHVTGTGWDPTACPGTGVQPVQITDPQAIATPNLGSAIPDAAGEIKADLDPQAAKLGDTIVATQAHCDGSSSSASTPLG